MPKSESRKSRSANQTTRLSARCLRELTDDLPRLLACNDRHELANCTAQILSRYIDMSNSTFAAVEPTLSQAYMLHTNAEAGSRIERHIPALFEFQAENAYFQGKLDKSLRQLFQTSDWIDDKALRKTGLFNEFLLPAGCERQLALLIECRNDGTRVSFGIQREGSDFTLQERAVFEFLRPYILTTYDRIVQLERTTAALDSLTNSVFQGDSGVIELDPAMRILRVNEPAATWLQRLGGSSDPGARLPSALGSSVSEAQPGALDQGYSAKWQIRIEGELVSAALAWNPQSATFLLLLEGTPAAEPPRDFKSLGLSPRQSEVLFWIAQGKSNGDIATILGLSPSTVAKHVEHIMIKLGVETRTAAAAQAWSLSRPSMEPS